MKRTNKLTVLSIVVLFSLLSSVLFPTAALADDATPPPVETAEIQPTEEPVVTVEPVVTEEPISTEEPVLTDVPTEAPVLDATPSPEEIAPAATDEPVVEEDSSTEETEPVDLAEIVSQAAEAEVVFADGSGDPLVLGTVDAAETLSTGDPWFIRGGVTYRFMPVGGCAAYGGVSATCSESTTPIQAALDDVNLNGLPTDSTVHVEAGIYNESIVISTVGLILSGDPGGATTAGAGNNAPVLQGSGSGSGIAVTINAGGVILEGFVIQGWDQAILVEVLVGKTAVTIKNNTIQNNIDGIEAVGGQGKPGTNANYNAFQNNSGFDIINNGPADNNVQNFNAENNYWGCPQGPVIAFKNPNNNNDWDYIVWAERDGNPNNYTIYPDNPFANCGLLYGRDSLWNHGGSNYLPYKIIVNSIQTGVEPTPTNTPT
ncbi:MAG TPA: hypothetical protein VHO49_09700, partial [Anaerolineales bacterium]|nr:hypothetical protein [Anaerolineales bacterium]